MALQIDRAVPQSNSRACQKRFGPTSIGTPAAGIMAFIRRRHPYAGKYAQGADVRLLTSDPKQDAAHPSCDSPNTFHCASSVVPATSAWSVKTRRPPSRYLSLIHISEPTRPLYISYAVFCLKKKTKGVESISQMVAYIYHMWCDS